MLALREYPYPSHSSQAGFSFRFGFVNITSILFFRHSSQAGFSFRFGLVNITRIYYFVIPAKRAGGPRELESRA